MEALSEGYSQFGRRSRLLKKHESIVYWIQILTDISLVTGLLLLLTFLHNGSIDLQYRFLAVIVPLLLGLVYAINGVYRRASTWKRSVFRLAVSWTLFLMLLVLFAFATKTSEAFSRLVFFQWAVLGFVVQIATFTAMQKTVVTIQDHLSPVIRSVIVGNGRLGCHLAAKLNNNRWLPDQVVGFVTYQDFLIYDNAPNHTACLGDLDDISRVVVEYDIRRVYIAVPLAKSDTIESLHKSLLGLNVDLIWVPDIYALQLLNHSVREVAGLPLICLNESPMTSTRTGIFLKEVMDRSLSALAITLLSPLLIGIALAIKLTSKGPVIFMQERHGWDGRIFKVWKFRSMKVHDDQAGFVKQARRDDDRITAVGRFIRKTSLDELPQLFNVLLGTMSLVGPRPHAVSHNDHYAEKIGNYQARHRIKPGITGLAQINGCRGETETDDKMHKRAEYDMQYINNWSLWLDIKILFKTPFTLFSKDIY